MFTAQKMKFSIKDFFSEENFIFFTARQMKFSIKDFFSEEIPNGNLHFLCSGSSSGFSPAQQTFWYVRHFQNAKMRFF